MNLVGHYQKKSKDMFHLMFRNDGGDYIMSRHRYDVPSLTRQGTNKDFMNHNIFELTQENMVGVFSYMDHNFRDKPYRIFIVKNPIFEADIHILRKGKISSEVFIETSFEPLECPMADNHDIRLVMEAMLNNQYRVIPNGIIISGRFIYNSGYSVQRE